jgi:hypothetical protein
MRIGFGRQNLKLDTSLSASGRIEEASRDKFAASGEIGWKPEFDD